MFLSFSFLPFFSAAGSSTLTNAGLVSAAPAAFSASLAAPETRSSSEVALADSGGAGSELDGGPLTAGTPGPPF